jgi:succinyl-CoA synthetase beta subunit
LENDDRIGSIIFNIFGGIMSCDRIAASILKAAEEIQCTKPIILRLKGSHSESAKLMIEQRGSDLGIYFCDDMDTAAELAVKLAREY